MRAALAAMLGSLAAGGCVGFGASRAIDADNTGAEQEAVPTPDAPAGYHATAVRFDTAGNDYIWTGSLANTTSSPRGTYSVWLRFHGGDGQQQLLSVAQVLGVGGVFRTASNHFQFMLPNCAGAPLLDMQTQNTYTTASGWVHLLASWDVSAGRADIYVNDIADRAANPTINNGSICYTAAKWGIGGLSSGQVDADVADLYAALGTYVDLDVEANRRRFSDAAGKPIDLGANCNAPTGLTPTGCFTGDVGMWNVNKGAGAGFTLVGDGLVVAPTSPND